MRCRAWRRCWSGRWRRCWASRCRCRPTRTAWACCRAWSRSRPTASWPWRAPPRPPAPLRRRPTPGRAASPTLSVPAPACAAGAAHACGPWQDSRLFWRGGQASAHRARSQLAGPRRPAPSVGGAAQVGRSGELARIGLVRSQPRPARPAALYDWDLAVAARAAAGVRPEPPEAAPPTAPPRSSGAPPRPLAGALRMPMPCACLGTAGARPALPRPAVAALTARGPARPTALCVRAHRRAEQGRARARVRLWRLHDAGAEGRHARRGRHQ